MRGDSRGIVGGRIAVAVVTARRRFSARPKRFGPAIRDPSANRVHIESLAEAGRLDTFDRVLEETMSRLHSGLQGFGEEPDGPRRQRPRR